MPVPESIEKFLQTYNPDGRHPVYEIEIDPDTEEAVKTCPFIIIRHGRFAAVIGAMGLKGQLDLDVFPYIDGKPGKGTAFGMTAGAREDIPLSDLVAVLIDDHKGE